MNTTVSLVIEIREPPQTVCAAGGVTSRTHWLNAHDRALAGLLGCQKSFDFHLPLLERGYR
jgi:hypothetical protein